MNIFAFSSKISTTAKPFSQARNETTWAKKQRQNKGEKEGGKRRAIKNQTEKRRKGNKTLIKNKKGWIKRRRKTLTKRQ
jgi:hypothetical protein